MRTVYFLLLFFVLLTSACAPQTGGQTSNTTSSPTPDTGYAQDASPTVTHQPDLAPVSVSSGLVPADEANAYWIVNPSSGARLYVRVYYPRGWGGELLPALVLVPGGTAVSDPRKAEALAAEGFLVIIFDPDGRGRSEGTEDYNGFIGQDGLAAVIEAATALPGLDANRYGLVSYSYGVTLATGALARHPNLPIDFYIDWEGPVNRTYTSACRPQSQGHIQWQPCENDSWWSEREALNFIAEARVPYQRIQSQKDHVQDTNNHAIDILNAAVAAGLPWARLNDSPANQTYDATNPPAMLPDAKDKQLERTVAVYAWYIIENVLGK